MQCLTSLRSSRLLLGAFSALTFVGSFGVANLSAAGADVPRVETDSPHYSIKQEIRFGADYLAGKGVPRDLAKSAFWYERAADAGDPLAQNLIGYFYQNGIGVPQDPARAVQWYQRAADSGYMQAKVNLALAYLWGIGARKDPQLAMELLQQAAAKNCGLADAYLGEIYFHGTGVPADKKIALEWYQRGAHAKDSIAEFRLAALLLEGNPSKQEISQSAKLLRKSVQGGFVAAQHSLGMLLALHPELSSQPNEAVILLQHASDGGIWQSAMLLGAIYRDGTGVPRDHSKAYFYFQIAQRQGGAKAHKAVNNDLVALSRELSASETDKLDGEAAKWVTNHPLTLLFQYKDTGSSSEFPIFAIASANDDTHTGKLVPASPGKTDSAEK